MTMMKERDEWKAKAEKLAERMDKREDTMRRLARLIDVTLEAEYSYNGDPQSVVDGGDFGELATLVFGAVRRLMSECGEWRAKAEQAERAMNAAAGKWAKADAELREGSSKVRAGSSNLEWLYEHDLDIKHAINCWVLQDGYGSAETFADAHKWLMSPHMEANGTANGTCPDAMGQASNADNCGTAEAEASQLPESDTREKLEADVRDYWYHTRGGWETAIVHEWLDRQAAITEREWESEQSYINAGYKERIAELEAERDYWRHEVQLCMDSAYPSSHSPEPPYAPEVMDYPTHDGYTTPSTLVSCVIDGLRDAAQDGFFKARFGDVVRLKIERDNLARDLEDCEREREAWRRACGGMLDAADEIHRIAAYMFPQESASVVDRNGEVIS